MDRSRRRFIQISGLAATGTLAGCMDDGGDEGGGAGNQTGDNQSKGNQTDKDQEKQEEKENYNYTFKKASNDAYWYSLYNMSNNIAIAGNGVRFPHTKKQEKAFKKRKPEMLKNSDVDKPPIKHPWLNMAPFTKGTPKYQQKPVLSGPDGRPDAKTLRWPQKKESGVVSPASLGWTHLKGVTWAKNFQTHFDVLPEDMAPKFRAQVLATLAQLGVKAALLGGGPDKNGALTKDPEKDMKLISGFKPPFPPNSPPPKVVDKETRPNQMAAMTWFLSDLNSLAQNGWFGYENPEPLIPAKKIQQVTNRVGKTTVKTFAPDDYDNARDKGLMLAALGWFGTHTDKKELVSLTKSKANAIAKSISTNGNGMVSDGAENQAATQGIVGQGLVYASQIDGIEHRSKATDVLGYMLDELWDRDAKTFMSGKGDDTYTISARDAGDITGGINVADAELGNNGARIKFAQFFNNTFRRGKLQRATMPQQRVENEQYTLPTPENAGGKYGQAPVYNTEVEYDTSNDEWTVTDGSFDTEQALYLANQDIWIGHWNGKFFKGRGTPGKSDKPEDSS
ncbi:MAG: plasmid stabilization protein [Halobacteria archaeon]